MFSLFKTSLWSVFCICVSSAYSQNLSYLTKASLTANPNLQKELLYYKELKQSQNLSKTLPDPKVKYTWFGESVQTKTGPQVQKFGLEQVFPGWGKRDGEKRVWQNKAIVQKNELQLQQVHLVLRIRSLWAEAQYLHHSKLLLDSTISLYEDWNKTLTASYEVGKSSYSDLLRVQTEKEMIIDQVYSLKKDMEEISFALQELLAGSKSIKVDLDSSFIPLSMKMGTSSKDVEIKKNPFLIKSKAEELLWKSNLEDQKLGFRPDVAVGVNYIQIDPIVGASNPWSVSVSMNLPFLWGKTQTQVEASQLAWRRSQSNSESVRYKIQNSMSQTKNDLLEARRKRLLFTETILPKIRQSITALDVAFQSDQISFIELLQEDKMRIEVQNKILKTYKTEFLAKAKLLWIAGDISEDFEFPYSLESIQGEKHEED